ncbi:head GIN domain-containing protein [uncultured Demequina sp.]|uniref:head GIN domain-containing protein n=1 Tax=uncultured Demequina sp. TaxID=693499 RepID=UPI0025FA1AB5|nr:head GIN domain-containing protein [uncultured Demequina sp.]
MTSTTRHRILGAAALGAAVATLAGCSFVGTDLDGVTDTESRAVDAFDRVEVNGSSDVDIVVGKERSVMVTGDTALLDRVLTLDGPDGIWGWTASDVHYAITVPALTDLELSGSGDISVTGVDSSALGVELSGSGDIQLAGTTDELRLEIDGSGRIEAARLAAHDATVDLSGSGDVTVNADTTLDVEVSGSGEVTYLGTASVSTEMSGSGEVRAGE